MYEENRPTSAVPTEIKSIIREIQTIVASTEKNIIRKNLMTEQLKENVS